MPFSNESKQKIQEILSRKLQDKNQALNCIVCGDTNFILADGFINNFLQDHPGILSIGGRSIPEIMLICNHCGHILKFSAGVLGLLPEMKEEKNKKNNAV
jgi:hypothetical protein